MTDRRARDRELGEQLAGWGKVALIETTGRMSGLPRRVAVGFVEEPDGSVLVAANSFDAHWAANLEADPACVVNVGDRTWAAVAQELDGPDRSRAIRELILRYGTPAEGLGTGPAFRLRSVDS